MLLPFGVVGYIIAGIVLDLSIGMWIGSGFFGLATLAVIVLGRWATNSLEEDDPAEPN